MKHLWDSDHSYYWNEGAYCAAGYHSEVESWSSFISEMGDADDDYNLLLRWDWELETDDDEKAVTPTGTGTLKLRYVLQRKGVCLSFNVRVGPDDEQEVRTWLEGKWKNVKALWAPFSEVSS